MLKIWGRKNSINVQKVLWCCEELGLSYDQENVGGSYGGLQEPRYIRMNPNGRIPTLEEDRFTLWESNTIVRYLAATNDLGGVYPERLNDRAHAEQWMDWQVTTLDPPFRTVFLGLIRTPPEKRDNDAIEAAREKVVNTFAILDRHLENQQFVCGNRLTIADFALGPFAYRWFNMGVSSPALPNVRAWYDLLAKRAAFQSTVMLPIT